MTLRLAHIHQPIDIRLRPLAAHPVAFRRVVDLVGQQHVPGTAGAGLALQVPGDPAPIRPVLNPQIPALILILALVADGSIGAGLADEDVDEVVTLPAQLKSLQVLRIRHEFLVCRLALCYNITVSPWRMHIPTITTTPIRTPTVTARRGIRPRRRTGRSCA